MTIVITIEKVAGGTEVTLQDLPPGLKPEDNEEGRGSRSPNLACHVERVR